VDRRWPGAPPRRRADRRDVLQQCREHGGIGEVGGGDDCKRQPIALVDQVQLASGFATIDRNFLEEKYGVRLIWGRRTVEAMVAGAALARDLGIDRGGPALVLRSVSFGSDERPVEPSSPSIVETAAASR
jgi:UTRA domain